MLRETAAIRRLALASFVYTGMQLCFITFMTVHLTSKAGFDLIRAGQALAAYQIAGVVSRPIWGWLADNVLAARQLLALQGIIMCASAVLAGQFGIHWPPLLVLAVVRRGRRNRQRLHRHRLRRMGAARRRTPNRSDRAGHRPDVRRRDAAALGVLGRG